jgi:hypothetical protein
MFKGEVELHFTAQLQNQAAHGDNLMCNQLTQSPLMEIRFAPAR